MLNRWRTGCASSDGSPKSSKSPTAKPAKKMKCEAPASASGSRMVQCPLCQVSFHSLLINAHVDSCLGPVNDSASPNRSTA